MKTTIIALLFCVSTAFAQDLKKIDTHEPVQINLIEQDGKFLAKADVYEDYVELHLYSAEIGASINIALELEQYRQIAQLTTSYEGKDGDLYKMAIKDSIFCIRFELQKKQIQAHLYMMIGEDIINFPDLNKLQFRRLFKGWDLNRN